MCQNYTKRGVGCDKKCGKYHKLIFCRDFQNFRCTRGAQCPYLHLGYREELKYIITQAITTELDRAIQYPAIVCNCIDKKQGCCNRIKLAQPSTSTVLEATCAVCTNILLSSKITLLSTCRHTFCISCVRRLDETENFKCPLCRACNSSLVTLH